MWWSADPPGKLKAAFSGAHNCMVLAVQIPYELQFLNFKSNMALIHWTNGHASFAIPKRWKKYSSLKHSSQYWSGVIANYFHFLYIRYVTLTRLQLGLYRHLLQLRKKKIVYVALLDYMGCLPDRDVQSPVADFPLTQINITWGK